MNPTLPVTVGPRHITLEIPALPALFFYVYYSTNDRRKGGYWSTSITYSTAEKRNEAMLKADCICAYPVDLLAQPLTTPEPKP